MANRYVQRLTLGKRALLDGAGLLAIVGPILFGLMIPPRSSAQASAHAADANLQFEVASIKHSDPSRRGRVPPRTSSPGRFVADHWPLTVLAMQAYGLKHPFEIDWKSSWMSTELYDVEAIVPAGATKAQIRIMLQHLLTDRFGLMVHWETRQLRGYRLVVAKGGPKLSQSVAAPERIGDAAPGRSSTQSDVLIKNGIPRFSESAGTGLLMTRVGTSFRGRNNSIGGLIDQLTQVLQGPVVDATGIKGEYDYDLSFQNVPAARTKEGVGFVPDGSSIILPANAGPAVTPEVSSDPPGGPTIWDALKGQLGLQLDSVKSVPVGVLVLDMAHEPTRN